MARAGSSVALNIMDKIMMGAIAHGDSRMFSQLRVLSTAKFVPPADLARLLEHKVREDPLLQRLRSMPDVPSLSAHELPAIDVARHIRRVEVPLPSASGGSSVELAANAVLARKLEPDQPLWDVSSFTDGAEGHGVVLRWNHWTGDGISSQVAMSRLFGFDFEVPAEIQARSPKASEVTWGMRLQVAKRLYRQMTSKPRSSWMHSGTAVPEQADKARVVCMDAADFGALRSAAKAQSTSVTGLLVATAKQTYIGLQEAYGEEALSDPLALGTTIAFARREDELLNNAFPTMFSVPLKAAAPEIARIFREHVESEVAMLSGTQELDALMARAMGAQRITDDVWMPMLAKREKPFDFIITNFAGPKERFSICGTPVTGMFNCMGHSALPIFTCIGYGGQLFVSMQASEVVSANSADVKRVWAAKLAAVMAGETAP